LDVEENVGLSIVETQSPPTNRAFTVIECSEKSGCAVFAVL